MYHSGVPRMYKVALHRDELNMRMDFQPIPEGNGLQVGSVEDMARKEY